MSQLLLQGFPEGASRIGSFLSILHKDGVVAYFVGGDRLFFHKLSDTNDQRHALAVLMSNGHVRPVDVERSLGIPYRTLMNWCSGYEKHGAQYFFAPRRVRGAAVMTDEVIRSCSALLSSGKSIADTARALDLNPSTLSKAIKSGRVVIDCSSTSLLPYSDTLVSKSERSAADAEAAQGMGTACTRVVERVGAAMGLLGNAHARFEKCHDVLFGGLLVGLPALCANGLFSDIKRQASLASGYYSTRQILTLLAFMALARIRRPEGLRHLPPGELGRTLGLDRAPEVRTLRKKIAMLSKHGEPQEWMQELSRQWMHEDPDEAGYLYVDGHVRVYHGDKTKLPHRYVSRERLCLRGTTDYWVNDALGRPFFVVSQPLTEGLAATLIEEIVPELLASIPNQPNEEELAADPLLHRFVVVFDREGATHSLLAKLWELRVAAITYRKAVKDKWPEEEFAEVEVPLPGGEITKMHLARRSAELTAGKNSLPVLEVRRLTQTGHQTTIITTAQRLESPTVAGRMFSRWCQENYFRYMMQHYDIDGLVEYGSEEIPGTKEVINPDWRALDKKVRQIRSKLQKLQAKFGGQVLKSNELVVEKQAELRHDIERVEDDLEELCQKRKKVPRKITLDELPEDQRPRQLRPLSKMFTDTIKMIAYRSETALVGALRPHLAKEGEARAVIRELFISSADIIPNEQERTLTIRIHQMALPAHNKAIAAVLEELNKTEFTHPEANLRVIYELV